MAISTKLMMRQGQALVMTPQLLLAIKLLQFSNVELSSFLNEELERNPLLEASEADDGFDTLEWIGRQRWCWSRPGLCRVSPKSSTKLHARPVTDATVEGRRRARG